MKFMQYGDDITITCCVYQGVNPILTVITPGDRICINLLEYVSLIPVFKWHKMFLEGMTSALKPKSRENGISKNTQFWPPIP
jgi:hypothetical protein